MPDSNTRFVVPAKGEVQPHTWVVNNDYVICLTQEGNISDELWNRFCEEVKSPRVRVVLGVSVGSASITSVQRKNAAQALAGKPLAAVLQSAVARGIITAMGWLGLSVKAYSWTRLDDAFQHLEIPAEEGRVMVSKLLAASNAPPLSELA